MGIKHPYTSAIVDDLDPNEVGPDEWNAAHVQDAEAANTVMAGPTTGAPATPGYRALVAADIPFSKSAQVPTFVVAAFNASTKVKSNADYVCDGIADSIEIANAIAALPASGGLVQLSEGQFNITSTINLASLAYVRGAGMHATVLLADVAIANAVVFGNALNGTGLSDLTINCDTRGVNGLQLRSVRRGEFPSIRIINCNATALILEVTSAGIQNCAGNHFGQLHMQDCTNGILFDGFDSSNVITLNFFDSVTMDNISGVGIAFKEWADNNYFSKAWIDLTANNAKGIVHNNSATPGSDVGVYANQFSLLAIDSFGITGATGIEFNETKQNIIGSFFHSPQVFNGTLINDVSSRAESYYIGNAQADSASNELEILDKDTRLQGLNFKGTTYNLGVGAGQNNNCDIGNSTMIRITGATGNFSITGFTHTPGRYLIIIYEGQYTWTIAHENANSDADKRIHTLLGTDVVLPSSAGTGYGSAAIFVYSSGLSRYILLNAFPLNVHNRWHNHSDTLDGTALNPNSVEMNYTIFPSQASLPAPTAGKITLAEKNDTLYEILSQGGLTLNIPLGTSIGLVSGMNHLGSIVVDPGGGVLANPISQGMLGSLTLYFAQAAAIQAGFGLSVDFQTGVVIGNSAGIEQINPGMKATLADVWTLVKFALPDITSIRMFIGWSDQTLATMVGADQPAGVYAGLQFSTPRGDVNWQYVTKSGGVWQAVNTGIAASTAALFYRQLTNKGTVWVVHQLFDATFTHVYTWYTNRDVRTTALRFVAGVETQVAAMRSLRFGYAYGIQVI